MPRKRKYDGGKKAFNGARGQHDNGQIPIKIQHVENNTNSNNLTTKVTKLKRKRALPVINKTIMTRSSKETKSSACGSTLQINISRLDCNKLNSRKVIMKQHNKNNHNLKDLKVSISDNSVNVSETSVQQWNTASKELQSSQKTKKVKKNACLKNNRQNVGTVKDTDSNVKPHMQVRKGRSAKSSFSSPENVPGELTELDVRTDHTLVDLEQSICKDAIDSGEISHGSLSDLTVDNTMFSPNNTENINEILEPFISPYSIPYSTEVDVISETYSVGSKNIQEKDNRIEISTPSKGIDINTPELPFCFEWHDEDVEVSKYFRANSSVLAETQSSQSLHSLNEIESLGSTEVRKRKKSLSDNSDRSPKKLNLSLNRTPLRKLSQNKLKSMDIPLDTFENNDKEVQSRINGIDFETQISKQAKTGNFKSMPLLDKSHEDDFTSKQMCTHPIETSIHTSVNKNTADSTTSLCKQVQDVDDVYVKPREMDVCTPVENNMVNPTFSTCKCMPPIHSSIEECIHSKISKKIKVYSSPEKNSTLKETNVCIPAEKNIITRETHAHTPIEKNAVSRKANVHTSKKKTTTLRGKHVRNRTEKNIISKETSVHTSTEKNAKLKNTNVCNPVEKNIKSRETNAHTPIEKNAISRKTDMHTRKEKNKTLKEKHVHNCTEKNIMSKETNVSNSIEQNAITRETNIRSPIEKDIIFKETNVHTPKKRNSTNAASSSWKSKDLSLQGNIKLSISKEINVSTKKNVPSYDLSCEDSANSKTLKARNVQIPIEKNPLHALSSASKTKDLSVNDNVIPETTKDTNTHAFIEINTVKTTSSASKNKDSSIKSKTTQERHTPVEKNGIITSSACKDLNFLKSKTSKKNVHTSVQKSRFSATLDAVKFKPSSESSVEGSLNSKTLKETTVSAPSNKSSANVASNNIQPITEITESPNESPQCGQPNIISIDEPDLSEKFTASSRITASELEQENSCEEFSVTKKRNYKSDANVKIQGKQKQVRKNQKLKPNLQKWGYLKKKSINKCDMSVRRRELLKIKRANRSIKTFLKPNKTAINDKSNNVTDSIEVEHNVNTFKVNDIIFKCTIPAQQSFEPKSNKSIKLDMTEIRKNLIERETWTNVSNLPSINSIDIFQPIFECKADPVRLPESLFKNSSSKSFHKSLDYDNISTDETNTAIEKYTKTIPDESESLNSSQLEHNSDEEDAISLCASSIRSPNSPASECDNETSTLSQKIETQFPVSHKLNFGLSNVTKSGTEAVNSEINLKSIAEMNNNKSIGNRHVSPQYDRDNNTLIQSESESTSASEKSDHCSILFDICLNFVNSGKCIKSNCIKKHVTVQQFYGVVKERLFKLDHEDKNKVLTSYNTIRRYKHICNEWLPIFINFSAERKFTELILDMAEHIHCGSVTDRNKAISDCTKAIINKRLPVWQHCNALLKLVQGERVLANILLESCLCQTYLYSSWLILRLATVLQKANIMIDAPILNRILQKALDENLSSDHYIELYDKLLKNVPIKYLQSLQLSKLLEITEIFKLTAVPYYQEMRSKINLLTGGSQCAGVTQDVQVPSVSNPINPANLLEVHNLLASQLNYLTQINNPQMSMLNRLRSDNSIGNLNYTAPCQPVFNVPPQLAVGEQFNNSFNWNNTPRPKAPNFTSNSSNFTQNNRPWRGKRQWRGKNYK